MKMKMNMKIIKEILSYADSVEKCSGNIIDEFDLEVKNLKNIEGSPYNIFSGLNGYVTWKTKNGKEITCNVSEGI
jgi:hypothetical protein